jgi:pimeloyl-ACP methyl ester carboxylesterase
MRGSAYQSRVIRKIIKYVAIAIVCLVMVVISCALLYRKYLQYKVAGARAITSPEGIDSLERVRIGGIDQWIQVRGQDVNNPILLFIHGGPGIAFIPLAGSFQGPWEKYFTVVQWDQRGAGKTYASNDRELQRRSMTIPQMQQDTLEVANYLRALFNKPKILVLGHSWGSILGLWLAQEHPEVMYAYVGTGQVINMEQNDQIAYQDALQEAHKRQNGQAIQELESLGSYPRSKPDAGQSQIERHWEGELLGPPPSRMGFTNVRRILTDLVSSPDYSLVDDVGFIRGQSLSLETMLPQVATVDLTQWKGDFQVPVFFFEGRQDPYCRPLLVQQYSQTMKAPQNELIWFEHSGHFPFFEEKRKFTDELIQRVLPLAGYRQ